jgi:dihydrofolate reductase
MVKVSLIVAVAQNGVIGAANTLPWHLPEDLAHFKRTTTGHSIIMGRRTFESIGRALPMRRNIVVTSRKDIQLAGIECCASLGAALEMCRDETEVFVIGGAALYAAALALSSKLVVTEIGRSFSGDAFFPKIPQQFQEVSREHHVSCGPDALPFDIVIYERQPDSTP